VNETTFQVLLVLRAGESQASEALERLRELVGEAAMPSLATFYRSLKSALDEGWVAIAGEQPSEGRGRPAHVYRLTPSGRKAIGAEAKRLEALAALARADDLARAPSRPR